MKEVIKAAMVEFCNEFPAIQFSEFNEEGFLYVIVKKGGSVPPGFFNMLFLRWDFCVHSLIDGKDNVRMIMKGV